MYARFDDVVEIDSESKFIWMRFLNSDQKGDFGAKSIIAAKPVIT